MSLPLIAFVNGAKVEVSAGSTVLDAVAAADPALAAQVTGGTRAIADSRGLPVAPDAPLTGGAVLRLISARAAAAEPGEA